MTHSFSGVFLLLAHSLATRGYRWLFDLSDRNRWVCCVDGWRVWAGSEDVSPLWSGSLTASRFRRVPVGRRAVGVSVSGDRQVRPVIDVALSAKQDLATPAGSSPPSSSTAQGPLRWRSDRAAAFPRVIEELVTAACHVTKEYAINPIDFDYGKSRLRPTRAGMTPLSPRDQRGARTRAEPPRPLRTQRGYQRTASAPGSLTHPRHLIEAARRKFRLLLTYTQSPQ
jgi:hypothetical protein